MHQRYQEVQAMGEREDKIRINQLRKKVYDLKNTIRVLIIIILVLLIINAILLILLTLS